MDKIVILAVYDNSFEANVSKGKLENDDIWCTLVDDTTNTANWYGRRDIGIKLCVRQIDLINASKSLGIEIKSKENTCPNCSSKNVKVLHFLSVIFGLLQLLIWPLVGIITLLFLKDKKKVSFDYRCQDSGHIFKKEF
jgi:hypothetical protein